MKNIGLPWIIHIFAILHAVVAFGCRINNIDDELLLTVLTMALAIIICRRKGLTIEFTAAIIIVMNILGYILGTLGANILKTFIVSDYAVHALSTAITTEFLGWSIIAMTKLFRRDTQEKNEDRLSHTYLKWILLLVAGIFVLRLLIVVFLSHSMFDSEGIYGIIRSILSNSAVIIMLTCLNILYVRYAVVRKPRVKKWQKHMNLTLFMVIAVIIETILTRPEPKDIPLFLIAAFLTQITLYCIIYILNYALTARNEMHAEREKASMAQYRYLKLKRQVNPHFLFNSLNILDCLICEGTPEQASIYTHKLAGIYRYMIKSEDEEVVQLRDELVFVNLYIDLLKIRFPEGFHVEINVSEDLMTRMIPPCSIQLLIENATKHNAVGTGNPLIVKVESENDCIHVENNIVPKVTKSPSTGLGQQYIRQLYMDLCGKSIDIYKTDDKYCVTLPLL